MSAWPLVRNRRILWCLAWAIATGCVILFLRAFDLRAAWGHMAAARPAWLLLAVVANFMVLPLLTEQWSRLLPRTRPVSWHVLWDCVSISMAAMNTLPFGGGHAVAAGLLATRGGGSVQGAVSLLALEQVCDGVAKLIFLLLALAGAPLPPVFRQAAWGLAAALVACFVGLLWIASHPVRGEATDGWRMKWAHHLEGVRRPGVLLAAVGLSLLMKLSTVAAIYAVQRSLGFDLPLNAPFVVLAAITFATSVSLAPGNLGTFEASTVVAYRLYGLPADQGVALGLVLHACFLLPLVGTGYGITVWQSFKSHRPAVSPWREPAD